MRWTILIEKYRTVTNVVGTVLIAWLLSGVVGETIALFLPDSAVSSSATTQAAEPPRSLVNGASQNQMVSFYMPICERNIFDSEKRSPCTDEPPVPGPTKNPPINDNADPVKSDIAAELVGTMVSTVAKFSFATINLKSKKETKNYRVDDSILGEGEIYEIERNKVFFYRNGRKEYLAVENLPNIVSARPTAKAAPSEKGVKREGDKITVTRSKVESTLGDLNKIIQQARMVPNYKNGAVDGFKIFAIRSGSIFQELGLRNGDVIHRINGTEINSVEKAIPMLQLARTEDSISIDMSRRGVKKTLSIDIQ